MKNGLDANIQSMSQAEKTMLRYQYVLANSTAAYNDFSRTMNSWANVLRTIGMQFQQLGSIVGGTLINAFKPFMVQLRNIMYNVISFVETIANALGAIFGWTIEINTGGLASDFGDIADAAGGIADGTGAAADNAEKLNKYIAGWHEVNNMTSNDDSTGGGSGGGGGGGGGGSVDGGLANLVKVDSALDKYKSSIDSLYELGDYIGGKLTEALKGIDWGSIYETAREFGSGLASFLNGLISPELFYEVGKSVAGALNTALNFLDSFGEQFDFKNFGESLGAGLVGFLDNIHWETALSAAKNWGAGVADALNSFISKETFSKVGEAFSNLVNVALHFVDTLGEKFEWDKFGESMKAGLVSFLNGIEWETALSAAKNWGAGVAAALNGFLTDDTFSSTGEAIGNALNTALAFLNSFGTDFHWENFGHSIGTGINSFFQTFKFDELGSTLNNWLQGILDSAIAAAEEIRWASIGEKIGEFLEKIEFMEIGEKVGKLIWAAINAGVSVWSSMFAVAPIETTILTALAALKITTSTISFLADLGTKLGAIRLGLSNLSAVINGGSFAACAGVVGGLAGAFALLAIGVYNAEKNWKKKMADEFVEFQERIGSNADALKDATDSLNALSDATGEMVATSESDAKHINDVADAYFNLASKTHYSGSEQSLIKGYAQELAEYCPILEGYIDGVTGKFALQEDEIRKLIQAEQDYQMAAAYKEVVGEYEQEQAKLNVQLGIAQENYERNGESLGNLNSLMNSLTQYGGDANAWAAEHRGQLKDLGVEWEDGSFAAADLAKQISFYNQEQETLSAQIEDGKEAQEAANERLGIAKEKYQEYSESAKEAKESTVTFQQGLIDLETDLSSLGLNLSETFKEDLVNANFDTSGLKEFFDSLKEGTSASKGELETLFHSMGLSLPSQLSNGIASLDAATQAAVVASLMQIQSGVSAQEPELKKLFTNLGISLPDALIGELAKKDSTVQKTTIELLAKVESGGKLAEVNLIALFTNLGAKVPQSLITKLAGGNAAVQKAAIQLIGQLSAATDQNGQPIIDKFWQLGDDSAQQLITAIGDLDDETKQEAINLLEQLLAAEESEREPIIDRLTALGVDAAGAYSDQFGSKTDEVKATAETYKSNTVDPLDGVDGETGTAGENAAEAYEEGLRSKQNEVKSTASQYVSDTKQPFVDEFSSSESGTMYNAGANASGGFWNGIKEKWDDSWLGKKIKEFKEAITGAQGLDEHSPSKVMRQFGAYAIEGFNLGLSDEIGGAYSEVGGMVSKIKDMTDISLPAVDLEISSGFSSQFDVASEKLNALASSLNSYQVATPDFSSYLDQSYALPSYEASSLADELQVQVDERMAEYAYEVRRQNDLLEEQNQLLSQIYEKTGITEGEIFNAARKGVLSFQSRAKKNPWPTLA